MGPMVPYLEQCANVLIVLAQSSAGKELHVATLLIGLVHSCVIMGFANSRFFFLLGGFSKYRKFSTETYARAKIPNWNLYETMI